MPRILFNDLIRFRARTGIAGYVEELLRHLPLSPLSETLGGKALRVASEKLMNHEKKGNGSTPVYWKAKAKELGQTALNLGVGATQLLSHWDLYHEPDVITLPISAPTVVTIPDLSVIINPAWHPEHRVKKYEKYLSASIKKAERFIAISENTKRDMVRCLAISADKIDVTPLAPRSVFAEQCPKLPSKHFLYVGTIEPRKNIDGLLKAYGNLPEKLKTKYPLLLAGHWGWKSEAVKEMLQKNPWKKHVRFIGFVTDNQLRRLMAEAAALVYPSFYEGFGLPPLEAMSSGTPVICTQGGALKETVGEAALIVDARDPRSLTGAMLRIIEDPELREELISGGLRQAAQFSWKETARLTWLSYGRVLGEDRVSLSHWQGAKSSA